MSDFSKNDRLRALEYVDDLIGVYRSEIANERENDASSVREREILENHIAGLEATVERLQHVRAVIAYTMRPRARRRSRTD